MLLKTASLKHVYFRRIKYVFTVDGRIILFVNARLFCARLVRRESAAGGERGLFFSSSFPQYIPSWRLIGVTRFAAFPNDIDFSPCSSGYNGTE